MTLRVRDMGRLRIAALVAVALLSSSAGAEVRHLPLATIAVGDTPGDVMSRSDAFLTEYRFETGGHSYALARALRGVVARDLVFIDDRLVCVLKKRRYTHWGEDTSQFWRDQDHWEDPVAKWEWANEPGGLEYLAATLRDACGLEPIRERRQLEREWSRRTMTGAEIADAAGEIGARLPEALLLAGLSGGYYSEPLHSDKWIAFEQQDRQDVERRIWSLTLGLPQEGLQAVLGVPDVQYTWPKTGTTVNAYYLGSLNRFFVGLIEGRAVWIHADYPGLLMQSKIAAQQRAGTQK
jgi:hypothetical protein